MWITDFILNSSITYRMERENTLSPKNQTSAYVIKEFYNDRLYLEKLPRLRMERCGLRFSKSLHQLHSIQYLKGNICDQKQNKTDAAWHERTLKGSIQSVSLIFQKLSCQSVNQITSTF